MDIQLDPKSTRHRVAKWIVGMALVIFGLLCLWLINVATAEKVTQMQFTQVTLHVAQRGTFTDTLVTRAVAIPNESVIIASERGGTVIEVRQNASNDVKKGDIIARLSNDDFVLQVTSRIADVTEQTNNLRNIRRLLEKDDLDTRLARQDSRFHLEKIDKETARKKTLYERGILEKATYEQLLDELAHWKTRYAILTTYQERQDRMLLIELAEIAASVKHLDTLTRLIESGLDKLVITAPIDGILSPLTIKMGQQIKPGEKVANVDNPHTYYFEASFSEYYLDKIRPHDRVTANYAGIDIPLIIASVSSVVENGKFLAKLTLAHPQQLSLKRGQSLDLRVSLGTQPDALLIPAKAVFFETDETWVYRYDEKHHRAVKTPVVIQRQGETQSQVLSGLSAGQQVVVLTGSNVEKSNIIEFE